MSGEPLDDRASLIAAFDLLLATEIDDDEAYVTRTGPLNLQNDATAERVLAQTQAQLSLLVPAQEALLRVIAHKRFLEANIANRRAPSAILPPEILSAIFIEGLAEHIPAFLSFSPRVDGIVPYLRTITQMCHVWRDVALSTSYLWSFICLEWRTDHICLCLDRAGPDRDLHVRTLPHRSPFASPPDSLIVKQNHRLMANFHRWRTLVIPSDTERTLHNISGYIPHPRDSHADNRLQELRLLDASFPSGSAFGDYPTASLGQMFHNRNPGTSHCPPEPSGLFASLSSLTLWSVRCSLGSSLQNVRELDLYNVSRQSWTSFQAAFSQAHRLETLRITSMSPVAVDQYPTPLDLPRLRNLTIGVGSHESFLASWFLSTTASNLKEFSFEVTSSTREADLAAGWLETFLKKTPDVTSLSLTAPEALLGQFLDSASASSPSPQSSTFTILLPALISLQLAPPSDSGYWYQGTFHHIQTSVSCFISRSTALKEQGVACAHLRSLSLPGLDMPDGFPELLLGLEMLVEGTNSKWPSVWSDSPSRVLNRVEDYTRESQEDEDDYWDDGDGLGGGSDNTDYDDGNEDL